MSPHECAYFYVCEFRFLFEQFGLPGDAQTMQEYRLLMRNAQQHNKSEFFPHFYSRRAEG